MKKEIIYAVVFVLVSMIAFSAFKDDTTAAEKQMAQIQTAVEENLALYVQEKDEACKDRAMRVALNQVDSIQNEVVTKSTNPKPRPKPKPKPKPEPQAPVTNPTPTPTPPPPPPTTDKDPAPKPPVVDGQGNTEGSTNTGKKDPPKVDPPKTDPVNTGVKNTGKKKDGN